MRQRRKSRKPIGDGGSRLIKPNQPPQVVDVLACGSKAEIESIVMRRAVVSAAQRTLFGAIAEAVQNDEADWDFTVRTSHGLAYIDCLEIFVLNKGGPHAAAPMVRGLAKFCDAVVAEIMKKAKKYGSSRRAESIHLLLYATDYRMMIVPEMADLLRLLLHRCRHAHAFKSIEYFHGFDDENGETISLFPTAPAEVIRIARDEMRLKGLQNTVMDPSKSLSYNAELGCLEVRFDGPLTPDAVFSVGVKLV